MNGVRVPRDAELKVTPDKQLNNNHDGTQVVIVTKNIECIIILKKRITLNTPHILQKNQANEV